MPDILEKLEKLEIWFLTGSQHLYGYETLRVVGQHAEVIANALDGETGIPVNVVLKPVLTTPESIAKVCRDANVAESCIGVVAWMHTFSPAKMWIAGLMALAKPLLHLHTQFNRELPWGTIDMDFMNLNQAAHGDREFGFLASRLRSNRKVVVGFWDDREVVEDIATWARAAAAWQDAQNLKVARFGDNMREVAVTEGNKVSAQIHLRYSVNGYGVGDLAESARAVPETEIDLLVNEYDAQYAVAEPLRPEGNQRQALRDAARIELGLREYLAKVCCHAFTDTFEDLYGLTQLPGLAVQRLMAEGYGFGGEGDWKTAALVRAMKVMAAGLPGGTSFMEDYTYHFGAQPKVLGAHMLEVCPSIASQVNGAKPSLEIHPLSIGGKADPVRLVFTAGSGPAINASVVDMGNRFRVIVNEVDVVDPDEPLPRLPVARAIWIPRPDLRTAATAWIYAGGAHHTGFSQALKAAHLRDFAEMAGVEFLGIGAETRVENFRNELRWNEASYLLRPSV